MRTHRKCIMFAGQQKTRCFPQAERLGIFHLKMLDNPFRAHQLVGILTGLATFGIGDLQEPSENLLSGMCNYQESDVIC